MSEKIEKLAVIGCGQIGSAVVGAILRNKNSPLKELVLTTKSSTSLEKLQNKFGSKSDGNGITIHYTNDNAEAVKRVDTILLAVEPFLTVYVLEQIKEAMKGKLFLSIIAGFDFNRMELYSAKFGIIMTSTLINYTSVPIAYTLSTRAQGYKESLLQMFDTVGTMVPMKSKDLPAIGAVLGCSTAFTLMYMDSVIKGGVSRGLTAEASKAMIIGVLKGTATMLERSGKSPDDIITTLCTPGGTTIEGIVSLEQLNFRYAVIKAIQSSTDKTSLLHK